MMPVESLLLGGGDAFVDEIDNDAENDKQDELHRDEPSLICRNRRAP